MTDAPSRPAAWIRPAVVGGAALVLALGFTSRPGKLPRPEDNLTEVLAGEYDLCVSPSDVFWVDAPPHWWWPWKSERAWILGTRPGGLDDVYLVHARRTPEGQLIGVSAVFDVTGTSAAAETHLTVASKDAAWLTGTDGERLRLTWATLDRPVFAEETQLTPGQKLQWHLTWLQEFGEWRGLSRRSFKLIPPARQAHVEFAAGDATLTTERGRVQLNHTGTVTGDQRVTESSVGLAQPGSWITWTVDRLRAMPWFGDENMQRLKAVVYRLLDGASRHLGIGAGGDETRPAVVRVAPEAAQGRPPDVFPAALTSEPEQFRRPWPPPPITPLLSPAEPAEGAWVSLQGDPFIKPSTDPAGLFYTTFLRTDPDRTYARILITAWDPLTVELHTQSGTEEPKSATGETGTGLVPRQGDALRLVAAFNGGFQATHGDFGMVAGGVVYVPPLPYAATVATDTRGRVGFGTWPEHTPLPQNLVGLRQNLTPLVAGGRANPYQRTWWGGVPSGWEDDTRTVRSGLCLTRSGLVLYFYGAKVDAENLAKAMLAAQCDYGLHLDMNQGHTGLEFYHVAKQEDLPPLALTLDRVWQAEGPVLDAPGLAFRGRRMFRAMQLMNFPRYIQRETRDFFYLTERPVLPRSGQPGWQVPVGARRVYPPALAVRSHAPARAPAALMQMLELDPELIEPEAEGSSVVVASLLERDSAQAASESLKWLTWQDGELTWKSRSERGSGVPLLPEVSDLDSAPAGACISAESGHLLFAELVGSADAEGAESLLREALAAQGCATGEVHAVAPGVFEVDGRDLTGHPPEQVRSRRPLAYRRPMKYFPLFPDTPIVPPSRWKPLQAKAD